jgi:hypothetical protein
MSNVAKDEIVLLRLAGEAIRQVLIKPPYCMEGTGCELPPCGCSQEAGKAALAAIRAAGWAVVPVEPTEEIQDAIINATFNMDYIADDEAVKIYQAVIKAAAPGVKP